MAIIEVELKTVAPRKWIGNFGLAAPTLDSSTGVNIGDVAVDSSASQYVWTCLDATVGAPVWQKFLTTTYINQNSSPSGAVSYFASSSPPTGWMECNGSAISRTTYAALFSNIGTTYGAGDNINTFNIPDLRGYFIRSWDHGAGIDVGRNIGTTQADAVLSHNHTSGLGSGATTAFIYGGSTSGIPGLATATLNTVAASSFPVVGQALTSTTGNADSHPKNVALMACIKY